jgi:hypothetical protein
MYSFCRICSWLQCGHNVYLPLTGVWHSRPLLYLGFRYFTVLIKSPNTITYVLCLKIFMKSLYLYTYECGARGSVVGWGTMLQAGRSRDRIPRRWIFFNLPNLSSCTMALGSTQPLTEMSTRNIPGGKGRPARKADNLTAIYEPIV